MSVERFFYNRLYRGQAMDEGRADGETHRFQEADEWLEAYKATLSKNQLDKFKKEWAKLEEETRLARKKADFGK